jgi:hypothetical protein
MGDAADDVAFIVSPSASCTVSAGVILAVELELSRPVDVRAFRLTTLPGF